MGFIDIPETGVSVVSNGVQLSLKGTEIESTDIVSVFVQSGNGFDLGHFMLCRIYITFKQVPAVPNLHSRVV